MWLILLIIGQKWIDFVCTGQTVCVQSSRGRGGSGGGGAKVGLISQCNYIFMILFIYLGYGVPPILRLRPAGFCVICLLWVDAPIQSTLLQWQSHTEHTHTHTPQDKPPHPHPLIEARVFPPARKASSCSTYTHSFPSPPPVPPHLIPSDWPPGSRAFSETSSRFLFLLLPVWIPLIYLWICLISLSTRPSIDQSISAHPPLFLYLRLVPRGRKGTGGQFQLRARSQTLLHLDFITNRPARYRRIIIRGKKWKKEEGGVSKACNVVNKFKLSAEKRLWYYFCTSKPKCEPASFVLADTNWKWSVILNHM